MLLLTHAPECGDNGVLVMGDVAVTPVPDANQLAQIAICTAQTAKAVAGLDPRVAMLSFSTKGSAKHEVVDKVVEALKIAKEMDPALKIDGELQADAAPVPRVGASKAPCSEIAGKANVLVVPCLEVGNISYKLVERLGHATCSRTYPARYRTPCKRFVTRMLYRRRLQDDRYHSQPGYCSKSSIIRNLIYTALSFRRHSMQSRSE